jgi:spore coat polysaccharide biosynthesis protein SpsF
MTAHRVAVIQARMTSSRLPGKVLSDIHGQPMLLRQIDRVRRARLIDRLVVATSDTADDDMVAALCAAHGVSCHRGSLDDVLDRFHGAARAAGAGAIVRLTGDCPLADPTVIDRVVTEFMRVGCAYASNTLRPTYPDGLDVEVMSFAALDRAWRESELSSEREHVTPYIYKHPELFAIHSVEAAQDRSSLRCTVDTAGDLAFIREVYGALLPTKPEFTTEDVLELLESRPELVSLNAGAPRNEGYARSLLLDRATRGVAGRPS